LWVLKVLAVRADENSARRVADHFDCIEIEVADQLKKLVTVMPDAGGVAEMKLKNVLSASDAVRSAAEKLTGVSSAPRADTPPSAVRGVLGVFDRLRGKGQKSGAEKP
jgi:hypothetical protein